MIATILGVILPWCFVVLGYWLLFQLLRQNGRILLRLDVIESKLDGSGAARAGARKATAPAGLPAGSAAPAFELADLDGQRHSLEEFRGRQVVAIFFNPGCGFCSRMVPELAALAADGSTNGAALPLVITTGGAAANRALFAEHKLGCPVLLQEQSEVASAYQARGTPTGYLIDEQGKIASALTIGAPNLLELIKDPASALTNLPGEQAAGDGDETDHADAHAGPSRGKANKGLESSKLNRSGLKAGTPAPAFRLPRLDGGELALEDYRGRRVLLVFSDPDCGPCEQVAPALEQLHRDRRDLAVVMISRRDVEANRRKVAAQGLTFPVVLQKSWEISRLYGMFATPIGYLIDEKGVIVADVAAGPGPILALASLPSWQSDGGPVADGSTDAPANGSAVATA
jgi:peroxiredoxin